MNRCCVALFQQCDQVPEKVMVVFDTTRLLSRKRWIAMKSWSARPITLPSRSRRHLSKIRLNAWLAVWRVLFTTYNCHAMHEKRHDNRRDDVCLFDEPNTSQTIPMTTRLRHWPLASACSLTVVYEALNFSQQIVESSQLPLWMPTSSNWEGSSQS